MSILFWLLISAVAIIMAFLGIYLIFSPSDHLTVRYQNFRLSYTQRPLKDEDFPNMPKVIWTLKLTGVLMLVAGATVLAGAI